MRKQGHANSRREVQQRDQQEACLVLSVCLCVGPLSPGLRARRVVVVKSVSSRPSCAKAKPLKCSCSCSCSLGVLVPATAMAIPQRERDKRKRNGIKAADTATRHDNEHKPRPVAQQIAKGTNTRSGGNHKTRRQRSRKRAKQNQEKKRSSRN